MKEIRIEKVDNGFVVEWSDDDSYKDHKKIIATLETVVDFLTKEYFL